MVKRKETHILIIMIVLAGMIIGCSSVTDVVLRKKWKLEKYDDWYVVIEEGEPTGYMHYKLDRYYNDNNEQRYEEDTHRVLLYRDEKGQIAKKITRSWVKTDKDLNILQFQFYSSPMYDRDKERFTRGIIKQDKLVINSSEDVSYEIDAKDGLPSMLNYRYIVSTMTRERGNHEEYSFFSLRYLTMIKESIVYSGDKYIEYKGNMIPTEKFLIMPYRRNNSMDSYYFTKEDGLLLSATLFQGKMYYQLSDLVELKEIFGFTD